MSEKIQYTVTVRDAGSTYHARCNGFTASSTASAESAAERAAMKAFGLVFNGNHIPRMEDHGVTLKRVSRGTFIAEKGAN